MAKSLLKLEARQLRQQGWSVKEIAKKLDISKSTVSIWVRDVILTIEQLEQLQKRSITGAERGRILGAFTQKQKRLTRVQSYIDEGNIEMKNLANREFLIAGLALYWGEGAKKKRRVELCNSDPKMIKFLTHWLKMCFNVSDEDLIFRIGINEAHIERELEVRKYWTKVLGVSLERFRKTSFKKVINKKVYKNFDQHFGTLYITVARSSDLYYKIDGLIHGLINGRVA
ncbi:helix-turn-helix domain-containing protein [Candidatus Daviesbacteria bacterium]|nr:helix-turn-helix domain-containing protein [Candidatus Daviesbacteria bacterium]